MFEERGYKPSLFQAFLLVAFACVALIWSSKYDALTFRVGVFAAILLVIFAFFVMAWITQRESIAFYEKVTELTREIKDLDPHRWQAIGIRFPRLRVRWDGKPLQFLEDSDILVEDFEKFMRDSNNRQISPKRNWRTVSDQSKWQMIFQWLSENDYIREYSQAGQHSWLWREGVYLILMSRYFPYGASQVPKLDEIVSEPGD